MRVPGALINRREDLERRHEAAIEEARKANVIEATLRAQLNELTAAIAVIEGAEDRHTVEALESELKGIEAQLKAVVSPVPKAAGVAQQGKKQKKPPRKTPNWTALELEVLRANRSEPLPVLAKLLPGRNKEAIRRKLALLPKEPEVGPVDIAEGSAPSPDEILPDLNPAEWVPWTPALDPSDYPSGVPSDGVAEPTEAPKAHRREPYFKIPAGRRPPALGGVPLSREEELAAIAEFEATRGVSRVESVSPGEFTVIGGARDPQPIS